MAFTTAHRAMVPSQAVSREPSLGVGKGDNDHLLHKTRVFNQNGSFGLRFGFKPLIAWTMWPLENSQYRNRRLFTFVQVHKLNVSYLFGFGGLAGVCSSPDQFFASRKEGFVNSELVLTIKR